MWQDHLLDDSEDHLTELYLPVDRGRGRLAAQVADALRESVRAGRLAPGARLPSSRDLATDLGVSRGAVVEAYEQLVAEGFCTARQGSGTRVAPLGPPPLGQPGPDGWDIHPLGPDGCAIHRDRTSAERAERLPYDLRPGVPDLAAFPRDRWLAALRHALATVSHNDLGYGNPAGAAPLRRELAGYLRRVRAAIATPERTIVAAGVAQGMALVLRVLAASGRPLLAVEDPSTHHTRSLLRATGVDLVGVPVDDEGIDVAALDRTDARAVLVTPAHQYPTGVVLSAGRRADLVAWARERDGVVIEDDYDAEFRYDREPVGCLQGLAPDRVVLTGSVSKALAPGLRLGWLVVPPWLADGVRTARHDADLGSPTPDQHALAHLISSGGYDRHLRSMRRRYRSRRDALVTALDTHLPAGRVHGVSAGLHLYVELPPAAREGRVIARAADRGVAVEGVAPMRLRQPGPPLSIRKDAPPHVAGRPTGEG